MSLGIARINVRYSRWGKKGTWAQLLSSVSDVPDLEYLMVDGSIVRVHQHGAASVRHAQAEALIAGFSAEFVLADKGYDSDAFVEAIKGSGAVPVSLPEVTGKRPGITTRKFTKNATSLSACSKN